MEIEDLEKLGIVRLNPLLKPNTFFIFDLEIEVRLNKPYKIENVFRAIHSHSYGLGVKAGEAKKANEIKQALNIE